MAVDENTINEYLDRLGAPYQELSFGVWKVDYREGDMIPQIIISLDAPLLVFRIKVMELPKENRESFYKRLLELNTTSMDHGAFGIEDNNVVLVDTLEVENLDYNEFEASIRSLSFTLAMTHKELSTYR
ncbi:MAG: YbjN domain-containing protein [bacterium]